MPASQSLYQKTLGAQAKPIIDKFIALRDYFGNVVAALPQIMSLFEDVANKAGQFNSSRLLQAELVKLVSFWNDETVMTSTKELLGAKICRSGQRDDGGDRERCHAARVQLFIDFVR